MFKKTAKARFTFPQFLLHLPPLGGIPNNGDRVGELAMFIGHRHNLPLSPDALAIFSANGHLHACDFGSP
jgi:hypothetical protein